MIKLSQTSTYRLIPQGRNTFKIKDAVYKPDESKVEVILVTRDGLRHIERFYFTRRDGSFNQAGLNAFSAFARSATGAKVLDQVETEELIGCYVSANVLHKRMPNRNDPSRTVTLINLKSFASAQPWGNNEDHA